MQAPTKPNPLIPTLMAALLAMFAGLALAQEAAGATGEASVDVTQNEQFGPILTDAEGRALYIFRSGEADPMDAERMTEGVRTNAAVCDVDCQTNWPPVTAESVVAGEGIDQELLYTADVNGTMQVVYNGWPLYYFANDADPGQVMGQGLGGGGNTWLLLTPEGTAVEGAAGGAAGEGAADDAEGEGVEGDDGAADDPMGDDGAADDGATDDDAADEETEDAAD